MIKSETINIVAEGLEKQHPVFVAVYARLDKRKICFFKGLFIRSND